MSDLQGFFTGQWLLEREIEDHLALTTLRFEGKAHLSPVDEGLSYREIGQWVSKGCKGLTGERRYQWRFSDEGAVDVYFDTGGFFHRFQTEGQGSAAAQHFCEPDQYDVSYQFDLPTQWGATWQVRGPRKNYVSQTIYRLSDMKRGCTEG